MAMFRISQGTQGSSDFFAAADATINNANIINNFMASTNLSDDTKELEICIVYIQNLTKSSIDSKISVFFIIFTCLFLLFY